MRATIQVNERGSWRNVASFDTQVDSTNHKILRSLRTLAEALGPKPTWRIKREGEHTVLLDDAAIRSELQG